MGLRRRKTARSRLVTGKARHAGKREVSCASGKARQMLRVFSRSSVKNRPPPRRSHVTSVGMPRRGEPSSASNRNGRGAPARGSSATGA